MTGGPKIKLYNRPYEDGIFEDLVSGRGIVKIYRELSGIEDSDIDAKEVGRLALNDNCLEAVETFHRIGKAIGEIIKTVVYDLKIKCVIMGGQISWIFPAMRRDLEHELKGSPVEKISAAQNIDSAALFGAAGIVI